MFSAGDLVVYGGEGVCRVEMIGASNIQGTDKGKMYYFLTPLYRTGQVMTPVDTPVLMRPVLSREEADELIAALPALAPEGPENVNMRGAKEYFRAVVTSYDCLRIAVLIKYASCRRSRALGHGKKVSQLEERYLKRAMEQLYGELAVALDMERNAVETYIQNSYPGWPEE